MKVCPQCGETYHSFVDFCFADGEVLTMEAVRQDEPEDDAFDAPPPPKMLQGAQGGGYTRSATPVPRARRPGRSVLNQTDGGGVYTPPVAEAPEPPADEIVDDWADDDDLDAFEDLGAPEPPPPPVPEPILGPARTPTPPPPQQRHSPRPASRDEAAIDFPEFDDEEDEAAGALPISMLMAGSFAVILFISGLGAAAIYFLIYTSPPDMPAQVALPEPKVDPLPVVTPKPAEPLQVGTQPAPEPAEPEPDTPEPEPDTPEPEPDTPEPGPDAPEPDPDTPAPAVVPTTPRPESPAPTNDGVAEVAPQPTSTVVFTTDPPGARAYLDGAFVGTTPTEGSADSGRHTVRYELDGHEPHETTILVNTSRLRLQAVTLDPSAAPEPPPEPVKRKVALVLVEGELGRGTVIGVRVPGLQGPIKPPGQALMAMGPNVLTVDFADGSSLKLQCNVPSTDHTPPPPAVLKLHECKPI